MLLRLDDASLHSAGRTETAILGKSGADLEEQGPNILSTLSTEVIFKIFDYLPVKDLVKQKNISVQTRQQVNFYIFANLKKLLLLDKNPPFVTRKSMILSAFLHVRLKDNQSLSNEKQVLDQILRTVACRLDIKDLSDKLYQEFVDYFKTLLNHSEIKTTMLGAAFALAIKVKNIEGAKLFLDNLKIDPSQALLYAICWNHEDTVKLLLAHPRVDPSVQNNEALMDAILFGYENILKLLLAHPKVDPGAENNEVLNIAIRSDLENFVKLLLAHPKVDPSVQNNKALREALIWSNDEVIDILLDDPRIDLSTLDWFTYNSLKEKADIFKKLKNHAKTPQW